METRFRVETYEVADDARPPYDNPDRRLCTQVQKDQGYRVSHDDLYYSTIDGVVLEGGVPIERVSILAQRCADERQEIVCIDRIGSPPRPEYIHPHINFATFAMDAIFQAVDEEQPVILPMHCTTCSLGVREFLEKQIQIRTYESLVTGEHVFVGKTRGWKLS